MAFTDTFLQGFHVGRSHRENSERLKGEAEDRKLQRMKLKHEMDRLKIQDAEAARKSGFEELQTLAQQPDPSEVNIPAGGYGQPARTMQTPGMRAVLAETLAAKAKSEREGRMREVSPEAAGLMGVPAGSYDADVLQEAGATKRTQITRDAMATEGARNRANQLEVARINASGRNPQVSADDDGLESWAKKLNTGQVSISNVPPGKNGTYRNAVVQHLESTGRGIMTPKIKDRIDQFVNAKASLDKIEDTFERIQNAESASERLGATLQLNAEVTGLSRGVGRSLGEKGVFTDQDKLDMAKIIQPGGGGIMTGILAHTAPEMGRDRIRQLRAFMDKVREREFKGFEELTGGEVLARDRTEAAGKQDGAGAKGRKDSAGPVGPAIGTRKKFPNGRTGVWDGRGWVQEGN